MAVRFFLTRGVLVSSQEIMSGGLVEEDGTQVRRSKTPPSCTYSAEAGPRWGFLAQAKRIKEVPGVVPENWICLSVSNAQSSSQNFAIQN